MSVEQVTLHKTHCIGEEAPVTVAVTARVEV